MTRLQTTGVRLLLVITAILIAVVAILLLVDRHGKPEKQNSQKSGVIIKGLLIDNYGERLEDREVYVESKLTKTDKKGRFEWIGQPVNSRLQVRAELSRNHWPPHEPERYNSYRYYPDVVVFVDCQQDVEEYEVRLVPERPEFVIEVEVVDSAGQPLPNFPIEIRCKGGKSVIPSEWAAERNFKQRTNEQGYCRFREVPNVEGLKLVFWGGGGVWNDPLSKEKASQISTEYEKYRWTEVPVEIAPGKKEYIFKVVMLTKEEHQIQKQGS